MTSPIDPDLRTSVDRETAHACAQPTRRNILSGTIGGMAAVGGLAAVTLSGSAQAQSASSAASGAHLATPAKRDLLVTLVQRTSQGYTRALHQEARSRGFDSYLEWQLKPDLIDDSAMDAMLATYATLTMTSKQLWDAYGPPANNNTPVFELRDATILRSLYSERQLFEVMVEFWADHFNTYAAAGPLPFLKTAEDRDVIRANALGKFRDLLTADAKSASMLFYLNNNTNIAKAPNENYSREVLELHTLGVDGPYFEQDVRELARCFTGWTFFPPQHPNFGDFVFFAANHDTDEKNLLSQIVPAGGGVSDGEFMLDFLAAHPSTAEFLSRKLARYLLAYEPPQAIVDTVTATYLATDGDIKEMIRAILTPQNLQAPGEWQQPKLKRPRRFVTGLMRSTGAFAQAGSLLAVVRRIDAMGQPTMLWETPDGFPDDLDTWGSTVLPRWEFATQLVGNSVLGVTLTGQMLLALLNGTPVQDAARAISHALSGGTMSLYDVERVQAYIDAAPTFNLQVLREGFALAASSPSYQYY
ncbi:MAG: hypothetical protein ACI841_000563 [Planctomycetota bacterium]|jgi:uncharacterized protein (DUF1800 family)